MDFKNFVNNFRAKKSSINNKKFDGKVTGKQPQKKRIEKELVKEKKLLKPLIKDLFVVGDTVEGINMKLIEVGVSW